LPESITRHPPKPRLTMNVVAVQQIDPAGIFACLAWAAVCLIAWRSPKGLLPGRLRLLLAVAGGCLAASVLADSLAALANAGQQLLVCGVELALLATGWLALADCGRRRLAVAVRAKIKAWWLLMLPAIGVLSGTLGVWATVELPAATDYLSGLLAAFSYLLGVPAALLAAAAFAETSRSATGTARKASMLAVIAMLSYGLANLFLPPPAAFFPADWLNQEAFLLATGIPAAWVVGLCGAALASALWIAGCCEQPLRTPQRITLFKQLSLPAAMVVLAAISLALNAGRHNDTLGEATLYLSEGAEHSAQLARLLAESANHPAEKTDGSGGPSGDNRADSIPPGSSHESATKASKTPENPEWPAGESTSSHPQPSASGDRLKLGLPLLIILFLLTAVLCALGAWASRPQRPSRPLRRRARPVGAAEIGQRRPEAVVPQSRLD